MRIRLTLNPSRFLQFADRAADATDPSRPGAMQDGVLAGSDAYWEAMRTRDDAASNRDGTWAEHAPSTIARRGEGAPILNETGQLFASFHRDGAGHILETTSDGVREGTEDRTARWHQDGTTNEDGSVRMPARPIAVQPDSEVMSTMKTPILAGASSAIMGAARGV